VDSAGYTTVAGSFRDTAVFGTGGDQVSLTAVGQADGFVARYRPDGTFVWVQQIGISGGGVANEVSVDAAGVVTVVGVFTGSATFGSAGNQQTLTTKGNGDIFIARYTPNGTLAWARQAGGSGSGSAVGRGVAVGDDGSATITGWFSDTATFGSGADQATLTSAGSDDAFVARYRSDGTLEWARQAGGSQDDAGAVVAVDSAGFAVVTGHFAGTAKPGTHSLSP
jgi:hypothetical protein